MDDDEVLHPQCWHDEDNHFYDADYAPRRPFVRRRVPDEWSEPTFSEVAMWRYLIG